MKDQREKCSGKPERKGGRFPYRPKGAPRPEPLADVPGPDHARFADIRPYFMQRKDDVEHRRREQLEAHRDKVAVIEDRRIRHELEREEAERQRGIDKFWRTMNRKVKVEREVARHQQGQDHGIGRRRGGGPRGVRPGVALAAYSGPIVDRRGRIGVFMSSTYLSAKTTAYGCMRRLSYYITKPESLEPVEGEKSFFSSMGETRHEIAEGMTLVEDANRAARANAKVAVTFIVQLPHDVTPKERLRILRIWCEEKLGVHDLPYVAALHKPSRDGDRRSYHGHVVTSFRPAYRTGRYDWRIARGLRTELDNPAMFEEFRRDFATIMTAVTQIAGKDRIYTHLSHAARGLKHKPTEKLGPQKTRSVREGEHVPANARNARTIATNEALAALERIAERTARRRRRMERLAMLKAAAARPLSLIAKQPLRDRRASRRPSPVSDKQASPRISSALLAAAGRAAAAVRHRPVGAEYTLLADVPSLHDAKTLVDSAPRSPSSVMAVAPPPPERSVHVLSQTTTAPERTDRRVRPPTNIRAIGRDGAFALTLSELSAIAEPVEASVRRPSAIPEVERQMSHVRSPSQPAHVEQDRPSPVMRPATVKPVEPNEAACRSITAIVLVERRDHSSSLAISTIAQVEPCASADARRPSRIHAIEHVIYDRTRSLDLSPDTLTRFEARVRDIERDEKAAADALAEQAAEALRRREQRRYMNFLALIALHPDWLEDGGQGLVVAPHAPPEAVKVYASWQNDHERRGIAAEVRQAVLDGFHRLHPDLAKDVARTIDEIASRLPAPPPFVDARGNLTPAVEVAVALVADNPDCVPASGNPTRLSSAASPALAAIVALYRQDCMLADLLAGARRYGQGVTDALHLPLARRIDQRRAGFALRRARGDLHAVDLGASRLSPAMVDHLAQARLHPEWVVRDPRLGLGLGEGASPMFRQQWMRWTDPAQARQLLIDDAAPAGVAKAMTVAMRGQVTARVRALTGSASRNAPPRSRGADEPSL